MRRTKRHYTLFALLCTGCVLATIAFAIGAARRSRPAPGTLAPKLRVEALITVPVERPVSAPPAKEARPAGGLLYFRANSLGENYGKLSVARLDALDRPQYSAELSCDRVHFAGGTGVCLASDRGVFTTYYAVMFDKHLRPGKTIQLNGIPSRARVSPSGRLAAITIFLSGHSYASLNFSTQTMIIDPARGEILADLEQFAVLRNGVPFQSPDFNFWGVTFAHDDNRFYATLWSKGKTYLIEGDLAKRTARIIYEGVECPSLSPDNTRIAFKKRAGSGQIAWRIHALDLATLTETPLGETRNVDDQVEWLDNQHVVYALQETESASSASTDLWVLPVSFEGAPSLLLRGGFSPAIVR